MSPAAILALISVGIDLFKVIKPQVDDLIKSGKITVEEQAAVMAKFKELSEHTDDMFSGDEWTKSDGTKSRSQLPG